MSIFAIKFYSNYCSLFLWDSDFLSYLYDLAISKQSTDDFNAVWTVIRFDLLLNFC